LPPSPSQRMMRPVGCAPAVALLMPSQSLRVTCARSYNPPVNWQRIPIPSPIWVGSILQRRT
jgi:hypothetical protein